MGFEPTRISPSELESLALTPRPTSLMDFSTIINHSYSLGSFLRTVLQTVPSLKNSSMRGVGFEPTQISLTDLKTVALTTRPSSLMWISPQFIYLDYALSSFFVFYKKIEIPTHNYVLPEEAQTSYPNHDYLPPD